ncbi:MAG TPA: class I SAM-dependent methyltransferase [Candidatus Solibacter sp.]|nr:class I SAM-dependent methyltransferase [Candidatus Solibacter sp.]
MEKDSFRNVYANAEYASHYARLEWTGTYYLIYRDLPDILRRHVSGVRALDFGCGTGRSTRLLRSLGYNTVGVDIAQSMIEGATKLDPDGTYRLLAEGDLECLGANSFDLILASFPFDNTPAQEKDRLFPILARLLHPGGHLVNIVSDPSIYVHEWASFTTIDFLEKNKAARDGDDVLIITREFETDQPARDIVCTAESYRELYRRAGLKTRGEYRPLGRPEDGVAYVCETEISPWVIYVLATR